MWACPFVLPFWQKIIKTMEKWVGTPVPEFVQLCLLGDRSCLPNISKHAFALVLTGFISAARVILRKWKSQDRPTYGEWVKTMTEIASFELLIAKLHDRQESYMLVWEKFVFYKRSTVLIGITTISTLF